MQIAERSLTHSKLKAILSQIEQKEVARMLRLHSNPKLVSQIEERLAEDPEVVRRRKQKVRRPYEARPADFWTKEGIRVRELLENERGTPCIACPERAQYEIIDRYGKYPCCEPHAARFAKRCGLIQ